MSIVTANIVRPFPGKRGVAEERFKKMASVFERLGATVKTTNFVAGEYTECIGLMRSYPDMKTGFSTLGNLANDAEAQDNRHGLDQGVVLEQKPELLLYHTQDAAAVVACL